MQVLKTTGELRRWRLALPAGRKVALVPTMGFLHEGHLSLLREARRRVPPSDGDLVLSIFVNPTQFGPAEDLARYPRDERGDLAHAAGCGVDVAFCPQSPSELYEADAVTWVEVTGLGDHLCGARRPGHFRGVCTIVTKLWNLTRPDVSVFGEKDYQQLVILRRVHRDLFIGGEIVGMPIVREADGLAMSSRNANLPPEERRQATAIFRFLAEVRRRFVIGERRTDDLLAGAASALAPGRIDYVEMVDLDDLQPIPFVDRPALCAVAVFFAGVRLIDNTVLMP